MTAMRKWDMLASKVKNEQRWKKRKRKRNDNNNKKANRKQATNFFVSQYDISFIKRVTRKFHVLVLQINDKEMYKKVYCTCYTRATLCFAN